MNLRDPNTGIHSKRVVELTLRLAEAAGIPEEDLVHVRRGVLLHDIGKMGVPDSILLKPGPLTDEEWEVMRHHPVLAEQLLSTIPFLEKAIEIPYCHHERWDGAGDPRGLKRDQIPLAARVFMIVIITMPCSLNAPTAQPGSMMKSSAISASKPAASLIRNW